MRRELPILMFLLLVSMTAWTQTTTQGTEFWLSFMMNGYRYNNGSTWVYNNVMISTERDCTGTIVNPVTGWTETFSVEAARVKFLSIPEEQGYNDLDEVVANKGLHVVTSDTVSLYFSNCATNSFDATFVLPVESLGTEYIVQTDAQSDLVVHEEIKDQYTSAFLVVATEEGTQVEITPSVKTIGGHEAGQTISVVLNAGQTYSVRSHYGEGSRDLSGSKVVATNGKKIAVFNGNTLTTIPNLENGGVDHIFEQALPIFAWGRHFAVTSSNGRTRDFVKVTSSADNNKVKKNGYTLTTLNRNESYTFDLTGWYGSCYIETSEPSVVYLYNTTFRDDASGTMGDPSMVWIPPVELKIDEITFCTFNHYAATIDNHYVNIVVERKDIRHVYFDGQLLDSEIFQPVAGNHQYYYTRKWIVPGVHHLSCRMGLMAHVYGFGEVKGYAYCVGSNIIDLRSQLFVNDTPSEALKSGYFACVDDTLRFVVETNYNVRSVQWDFDGTQQGHGEKVNQVYHQAGDYVVSAFIEGTDPFTQQAVSETRSVVVHVGEPEIHDETHAFCNYDFFDYYGVTYSESGHYERLGVNVFGCDSSYYLNLDLNFTPEFVIEGEPNPVGGSETHIGIYDYALHFEDTRTQVDTVLWQVDCPNWRIAPRGKGETCSLYIHSLVADPVLLHATAINCCDTVRHSFALKTTYFDVPQQDEEPVFAVSPNPAQDYVNLRFEYLDGRTEIIVYNSQGQKVDVLDFDATNCKERTYIMSHFPNGLYYFVLKNKDMTLMEKVALVR